MLKIFMVAEPKQGSYHVGWGILSVAYSYRISPNKHPQRLLNPETVRCGANSREVLNSKLGKWTVLNVTTLSFFLSK